MLLFISTEYCIHSVCPISRLIDRWIDLPGQCSMLKDVWAGDKVRPKYLESSQIQRWWLLHAGSPSGSGEFKATDYIVGDGKNWSNSSHVETSGELSRAIGRLHRSCCSSLSWVEKAFTPVTGNSLETSGHSRICNLGEGCASQAEHYPRACLSVGTILRQHSTCLQSQHSEGR